MKKAFCTGTLAVSLLLGAARAADLFLNTDTATGFLLSGSVWTRYWLLSFWRGWPGCMCRASSPAGCGRVRACG